MFACALVGMTFSMTTDAGEVCDFALVRSPDCDSGPKMTLNGQLVLFWTRYTLELLCGRRLVNRFGFTEADLKRFFGALQEAVNEYVP